MVVGTSGGGGGGGDEGTGEGTGGWYGWGASLLLTAV